MLLAFVAVLMCGTGRDASGQAATQTTLEITANGATATTVPLGTVVTLTATVTAAGAAINPGQIYFCTAAAKLCTDVHRLGIAQLTSNGTATMRFIPSAGVRSYQAIFLGTGKNARSVSTAESVTVQGPGQPLPTESVLSASGSPGAYTLTATVSGSGSAAPEGTISFEDLNNLNYVLGTAPLAVPPTGVALTPEPVQDADPGLIVTADFNNDGIPDIAMLSSAGELTILLGKGDGTFTAERAIAVTDNASGITVGDFNGDGIPDIAVSGNTFPGQVNILLGNGDGTFREGSLVTPVTASGDSLGVLVTGDFNGDGNQDIAVADPWDDDVIVLLGHGDGTFTQVPAEQSTGDDPYDLIAEDFNGDGKLDLVTANIGDSTDTLTVLKGNGDGTFVPLPTIASQGGATSVVAADFNSDGKLDLAAVNLSFGEVIEFSGNGDGTFTANPTPLQETYVASIAVGDFNGDGIADLAAFIDGGPNSVQPSTLYVAISNDDGTFTPIGTVASSGNVVGVVADFNSDGIPDIATPVPNGIDVVTIGRTGNATATLSGVSPVGTGTHEVDALDADSSGVAGPTSNQVPLTAEPVPTQLALTTNQPNPVGGQSVTLTATLNVWEAQNHSASGEVTFSANGATLGTAAVTNGVATLSPAILPAGPGNITASYAGDTNFQGSTATAVPYSAGSGNQTQTISFPLPGQPTFYGASDSNYVSLSLYLQATAQPSNLPVTYKVVSGPATISGNVITYTGVGAVTIEADQAGGESNGQTYAAATPVQQTVQVGYLPASGTQVESTVLTFTASGQLEPDSSSPVPWFAYEEGPVTQNASTQNGTDVSFQMTSIEESGSEYCQVGVTYSVGQTCLQNFIFTPTTPGLRSASIGLTDANGDVLAQAGIFGIDVGPMITFANPTLSTMGRQFSAPGQLTFADGTLWVPDAVQDWVEAIGPPPAASGPGAEYSASLNGPEAVAIDAAGDVFVADTGNHELKEMEAVNGAPHCCTPAMTVIDTGLGASFSPSALVFDGFGNLFVADTVNHAVYEVFAGPNGMIGPNPTVQTLSVAFTQPVALAYFANVISNTNIRTIWLYVLDAGTGRINSLLPRTGGEPRVVAQGFTGAQGIAVDAGGDILVADTPNASILELPAVDGAIPSGVTPKMFWQGSNGIAPAGLALGPNGNVYFSAPSVSQVFELDVSDPPTLQFEATPVGTVSPDSPQTVTLINDGNAALDILPPSGEPTNPYVTPGFTLDSSTCPVLNSGASSNDVVQPGGTCAEAISYTPVQTGAASGQLIVGNSSLVNPVIVPLDGGDATATHFVVTAPATATSGQPIQITVTAENAANQTETNYTGSVALTSSDAAAVLPPRTVMLSAGVGTFQVTLNTVGAQTVTATDSVDNITGTSPSIQVGATSQTINFPQPSESYAGTSVSLNASAGSGQPVIYTVLSGPATVAGNVLTYTGVGQVVVQANVAGGGNYQSGSAQISVNTSLLTEPVGTASAPVTTVVTFTSPGELNNIAATIEGETGKDFQLAAASGSGSGACAVGQTYSAGDTCTVTFVFQPTLPGLRHGAITLTDGNGDVLANSFIYGSGVGPELVFLPQTQSVVAGGFIYTSGVATDGKGDVFISDGSYDRDEPEPEDGLYEVPAGTTNKVLISLIPAAEDVAVDGAGDVIVCSNTTVYEIVAVNGTVSPTSRVVTLASGFSEMDGVSVDGNGNIFIANYPGTATYGQAAAYELVAVNGRVPPNSTPVLLANSFGPEVSTEPTGIATDVSGNVYLSDQLQDAVFEIEAVNGVVPASPTVVKVASFVNPSNVAIDPEGNLYITDYGAHQLDKILAVNGVIPTTNPQILTLGSGLNQPQGVAVDANGNVYIADSGLGEAVELQFSAPPSLTFAPTVVGSTSTDSPQTVTVMNNGNAPLLFTQPLSGNNPTITPGFTFDSSSTCPLLQASFAVDQPPAQLVPGASCTDVVSFTPVAPGPDSGALVTTDNNLAITNATQTIPLNGVGIPQTYAVSLTAAPTAVFLLNPVTLTAVVTTNGILPAGTVSFFDGGTLLGTTSVAAGGASATATFSTASLPLGAQAITASFSDSATADRASSAPETVLVEDFSIGFAKQTVTIPHGGTASFTLNVAPIEGATTPAAIALAVAGEPDESTVTWSEQSVPAGSGATTVTLTIKTPDYPTGPFAQLRPAVPLSFAAGLLLLPFAQRKRRAGALRTVARGLLVAVACVGLCASLSGCGSGWKTQSFTVSVTGSSGPLSHTATAELVSQ